MLWADAVQPEYRQTEIKQMIMKVLVREMGRQWKHHIMVHCSTADSSTE